MLCAGKRLATDNGEIMGLEPLSLAAVSLQGVVASVLMGEALWYSVMACNGRRELC